MHMYVYGKYVHSCIRHKSEPVFEQTNQHELVTYQTWDHWLPVFAQGRPRMPHLPRNAAPEMPCSQPLVLRQEPISVIDGFLSK